MSNNGRQEHRRPIARFSAGRFQILDDWNTENMDEITPEKVPGRILTE